MRVRVLIEQRQHLGVDRPYLPSGEVVDIDADWALELLNRGDAEAIAEVPTSRSEKRPSSKTPEKR